MIELSLEIDSLNCFTGFNEEQVIADVEQKLDILHAFKDRSKLAVSIEASPNGRYSAILDFHHRVLIQVPNLKSFVKFNYEGAILGLFHVLFHFNIIFKI